MVTGLRKTGIGVVGDLPWGTHFCHFYATKEDLIDILIPYFQAGLESNEFCMWVVFDLLKVEEAKDALRAAVPGADRHLAAGSIEILPHSQWYLKDGTFDLRHVIDGWKEKLARALASGYEGMRVNGNEAWLTEKDWKDFSAYEKELNKLISDQRILVLCTYPLEVTKAAELFDVAQDPPVCHRQTARGLGGRRNPGPEESQGGNTEVERRARTTGLRANQGTCGGQC